ncbi:hypothetical protein GCM10022223_04620 [Kineosporia mesophila]|uniref:DUF3040 domain-containing protein n=1 Tax=Kineosporia mesophila TaxID=566012 RepID=A0ABP6YWH2_9ACTN|nr:hypothetical protein [Kineosporia mesophila]MCD5354325.1 hypothetical protein [Kineosporia mesophila]
MTDEEELAQRLRGQLDDELGDIQVRAGSRERLRQGLRGRRRAPWLRASVMVPVAMAGVIAAVLLAVPALLHRDEGTGIAPAGEPSVIQTETPEVTVDPVPTTTPADDLVPDPSATRKPAKSPIAPTPVRSAPRGSMTRATSKAEVTATAAATPATPTQEPAVTLEPTPPSTQEPTLPVTGTDSPAETTASS